MRKNTKKKFFTVVLEQTTSRIAQIRVQAENEDKAEELVLKQYESGKIDEREWQDTPPDDDVNIIDVLEDDAPKKTGRYKVIT